MNNYTQTVSSIGRIIIGIGMVYIAQDTLKCSLFGFSTLYSRQHCSTLEYNYYYCKQLLPNLCLAILGGDSIGTGICELLDK